MKRILIFLSAMIAAWVSCPAQDPPPVIGLCLEAPRPDELDRFIGFMKEELGPGGINTLVLMVDYQYAYRSHPELRDRDPLKKKDVKKLLAAASDLGIRIIPHINLLGHQSRHEHPKKLLEQYPEFDETPSVEFPEQYEWPNEDGLYCKSYCPLHPDVHKVVFDIVDELMKVFEADAFHAGMDEVFYIGMEECPRCSGKDRSALFAGEVNRIHEHLSAKGQELWIWGDRLIDGITTGVGIWEGSGNDTYRAIDLISTDVVICDWHYERADPTAALFALKGFRVITCPWRRYAVTAAQLEMFDSFRAQSPPGLKDRYYGFMQTVWTPAGIFLDSYYKKEADREEEVDEHWGRGQAESLRMIMEHYRSGK